METSGVAPYESLDYSKSLGRSVIFLALLALSFVGWFTSLVSQAIVTADQGNDTVGTLWFGIILQLGVIVGIIVCWLTESLFQYGITLAVYAALATSYGAQGVHFNVFGGTPAQQALSAGWIITCIVDVLWILILSSEPSSYVYRFVANNGNTETHHSVHGMNGTIPNVGTNMDAFGPKYTNADGIPLEPQPPMMAPDSIVGSNADNRSRGSRVLGGGGSVMGEQAESHRRRSAGLWSTPPQTPGGGRPNSMRDVPPVPAVPEGAPLGLVPPPAPPSEGRPASTSNLDTNTNRPDSTAHTTTDATPVPQHPLAKALALFDYTASPMDPYELTFTKGEVLEVLDKSGKWWEAIKPDGTKGIAPSNYLKLM